MTDSPRARPSGPLAGVRIAVAVTAPSSAGFYAGQLAALREAGADVAFLASPSDAVAAQCAAEGALYVPIAMERAPALWSDARALREITRALARLRPDIVNAGTPKAGLLGMVAAATLRVPCRVQTLHGLRYEVAHGLQRRILWLAQRASCAAATHVVCVSRSLRDRATATGLIAHGRGVVIGDGSVNGVEPQRFQRSAAALAAGAMLRKRHGIAAETPIFGFIGRMARDKGIGDLAHAWTDAPQDRHLIIAGDVDDTDPPDPRDVELLRRARNVTLVGQLDDPVDFYAALDVLVLPTLREGFPTVALEASSMGLPIIATRVTGCADAIQDGVTGVLVPAHDPRQLAAAMDIYASSPALRAQHGASGRARVVNQFSRDRVHKLTIAFYQSILR